MKFALVDAANLFNRAHHVCGGDAYTKAGMALHIIFNSLAKAFRVLEADHIVLCAEGRSWRYDHYPQYKAKRKLLREMLKPREKEEQEVFFEVLKDFVEFMHEKTRCTVLQSQGCEADDLIARFIQLHPQDEHVIISADSDMIQLLSDNVSIYNGITDKRITTKGVFDDEGREMVFSVMPSDGKVKIGETLEEAAKTKRRKDKEAIREAEATEKALQKEADAAKKVYDAAAPATVAQVEAKTTWEKIATALNKAKIATMAAKAEAEKPFEFSFDPEWYRRALFIKLIRGDVGDGVFSAYPGIRYHGTSKKVGIEDAWNDRETKGFNWNNFMLQTWEKLNEDGSTETVTVANEFARNEMLIDLTKQPDEVKDLMDRVIVDAIQKEPVGNVGIHFMQFCSKHDLNRIAQRAQDHARYLNAGYFK